jgi:hypothetical protein
VATGRKVNKINNNKPTIGYMTTKHNNKYDALSTSIKHTPDPPCEKKEVAAAAT